MMLEPAEVAAMLREIAVYLELEGERFRARAYHRAARSVEPLHDLAPLVARQGLHELAGIGPSLASLIEELWRRGHAALLDRLRARWPALLVELARLPGVGAARARKLVEAFEPSTLEEIAELCESGRVRALPGFGKVSEARLRKTILERHERTASLLLHRAREMSSSLLAHLRAAPAAARVEIAGPARRWLEIADHLALAVATPDAAAIRDRLMTHPLVVSLVARDEELAVARLATGVICELYTAPPDRFGMTWLRATGSEAHVAALVQMASGALHAPDELGIYRALGLPAIPPELRDGDGEIAAALQGDDFADLVTLADVKGVVHCHTTYSDGKHSVEAMARAAEEMGLAYMTITDHSQTAHYAGGLSVERLAEQKEEIEKVQHEVAVRLLRGTESDILKDGALDYPLEVLRKLDVVVASIHQRYRQDEDAMTKRLVTAMRQPIFKIWGHALGRLLMRRDPVGCRFDEVLDAIGDNVAIELNGNPWRLDLNPVLARQAHARGARFVLSADAHSIGELKNLEYAVAMARRARLRKRDVLNTLPAEDFARAVRPG